MQLIFENMDELREMIAAMGYVKDTQIGTLSVRLDGEKFAKEVESAVHEALTRTDLVPHSDEGFTGPVGDALRELPGLIAGEHLDAGTFVHVNEGVAQPAEPTKRKRRTKAEIEADKAAEAAKALADEKPVLAATVNPLDNLKSDPAPAPVYNGDAHQAITETAGLFDGNDKLAHLNEGREFISKHGFALYNESQRLADVPPNIAAHTPEQVSRHRAAMAWLHEQQSK